MSFVKNAIDFGTVPANRQVDAELEWFRQLPNGRDGGAADMTVLDVRDDRSAHTGPRREVGLPPPASVPEDPD